MHDNLEFYNSFIKPFIRQAYVHEKLDDNKKKLTITFPDSEEECCKRITAIFDTLKIDGLEPSRLKKEQIRQKFLGAQALLIHMTNNLEERASVLSNILFIRLIAFQVYINSFMVDYDSNLEFYRKSGLDILGYFDKNPGQLEKAELASLVFLKRCLYLADHNSYFIGNRNMYARCVKLISDDVDYSKNHNQADYIKAVLYYVDISFDHLGAAIGREKKYVTLESLGHYEKSMIDFARTYTEKLDSLLAYRLFSALFKLDLFRIKQDFHDRVPVSQACKNRLLRKCTFLIDIFFGEKKGMDRFFADEPGPEEFALILQEYSKELARLLAEKSLNTSEPLFLTFQFLSLFPEFKKLNLSIYKRLSYVSKEYYNRKTYVLSNLLYIKCLDEMDVFNREIGKIKRYIEEKPVTSLISLYNSEINLLPGLTASRRSALYIDHHIVDILHEVKKINMVIRLEMINYREKGKKDPFFRDKNILLTLFGNDLKNTLTLAADSTLCSNLNRIYSAMLDKYLEDRKLDFRDDLVKELNMVKMSIAEVNPMHVACFLMIYKLGKVLRIIHCKDPAKLETHNILAETPDEIAKYLVQIERFFEDSELSIHADKKEVVKTLNEVNRNAVAAHSAISVEARLIRILTMFLSDVLEYKKNKKFITGYYDNIYAQARKEWIIDPVLVYYLNEYLASKSFLLFKNYLTGDKIYYQTELFTSKAILDVIFNFVPDLVGRQEHKVDDLTGELEDISRLGGISLLDKEGKRLEMTLKNIKEYVIGKKTVYFEKTSFSKKDLIYLNEIINLFLIYVGKKNVVQTLFYIMRGLITNAHKGNIKRAFFHQKELDIVGKYPLGIKDFTYPLDETGLTPLLEKLGLTIRIEIMAVKDRIIVSVINKYALVPEESELINKRILLAQEIKSLQEAYVHELATGEGEGLGLIVAFLLLKKLGLGTGNFKVESSENRTCCKVVLPITEIKEEERHRLAQEIAKEVENIPMIPDNILKLKKMIKDTSTQLPEIESVIHRDPSLSAIVLKTSNSAFYSPANKIGTILDGIKILGTRGLDNLLTIFGAYKLLEEKNEKERIEKIIDHSEKTAFYVKELINLKGVDAELDDIFLPTLLHDIGKLIIEGLHPDLYHILEKFENTNNIPKDVIEDLMGGLYHDLVGYHLAKKWNFPELACESIRFHHQPRETDSYFDEVFTIYLANILTYYNEKKVVFENVDSNVLNYFEIRGQEQLSLIAADIEKKYAAVIGRKSE